MKERKSQCNHNLHVLQSNISTNFYNYWIYFIRACKHLNIQSKFIYCHIVLSLLNIDINSCQGRVKFKSLPNIQICLCYLGVLLGCFNLGFDFFANVQVIISNQYVGDIIKFFITFSLKMFLSYSTLSYLSYIYITYRDCVHMTSTMKGREWF